MTTIEQLSEALAQAVEAAAPAVVGVLGPRRPVSGTIWGARQVVTCAHGMGRRRDGRVRLHDGAEVEVSLAGVDRGTDLALLVASADLAVPARVEAAPRPGHLVLAVGRPDGGAAEACLGMVRGVGPAWFTGAGARVEHDLVVDGELPRGFAGGPLVDGAGRVIGVNTPLLRRGGTTLPAASVDAVVALLARGDVRHGYLGVGAQPARTPEGEGLLVTWLQPEGPAAQAGVQVGDILWELEGERLARLEHLIHALRGRADVEATLGLRRGGAPTTLRVTTRARPV